MPAPVDVSGARQVTYINPYDYAHLIPARWEACRPPPTATLEFRVYDISTDVTIHRLEGGPAAAIDKYYVLVCNGFYNECAIHASDAPTDDSINEHLEFIGGYVLRSLDYRLVVGTWA